MLNYMKKLSILFLSVLSLTCLSGCLAEAPIDSKTDDTPVIPVAKNDFTGITFSNVSFVYDGTAKSIYVSGAPDFATVTYEGNDKTDAGSYTVFAHITAENYNDLDLSATLTITKATFADITFEGATVDYDGQHHSIYVSGTPDFATVTYKNNGKTSVGTYTVTATISAANYNTLTKTATLRIVGKTITGVTFSDGTFEYDGNKHSIFVSGELPEGVSVSYSGNNQTNAGTYQVTATLTGEGYEKLELKANLIIKPAPVSKPGSFYDRAYMYDGNNHSLVVENAPYGSTVTYRCTNASGINTFKNPGSYVIEATVKINNNQMSTLTATLTILEPVTYGVDSSKTGLTIDDNLKWDQLHTALKGDNFTEIYYSGSYDVENEEDLLPATVFDEDFEGHDWYSTFVTDGKQAYIESLSTYSDPYNTYVLYTEVGNDISRFNFSTDNGSSEYEKFPKAAFSETVCRSEASNALVALTKGENGEFKPGIDGDDYYKDAGVAVIEDNQFMVLMCHQRTLDSGYRYFYEVYKFYNIGNTKLNIPNSDVPSQELLNKEASLGDYRLGGVKYRYSSFGPYNHIVHYFTAELYVSYHTKIFLEPGTYTVLPYIYDNPVRAIVHYDYYSQYRNYDQSGYTFNLYIDNEKNYQGEYAELGSVARLDIKDFTNDDGVVNYYADWHE